MVDSARLEGMIGRRLCLCVFNLAATIGCSTLDGRDRGYAERLHPVVASGGAQVAHASSATSPANTGTSQLEPTSARSYQAPDQVATASTAASGVAASPQEDLTGIERSYLLPLGDTGTHAKVVATRYANLQPAACRAELRRRRIAIAPAGGMALGIATPMRLAGPLRGVRFIAKGPKSVHGMLDCRLVLLLYEASEVLAEQGVAVVYVDGFYRPKAHLPGSKSPSQHAFGLAADIHGFGTKDGRTLIIERDFAGSVGAPVCGIAATLEPERRDSIALRNIVCALARSKVFHYLLTPNYDVAHVNHLHGDIKRGGKEHVVR